MNLVYLNGDFVPREGATVSVFDHGFLYGDGVFEGIRAYEGKVFRLEEHIDRLYRSAKGIAVEIPLTKSQMKEAMGRAIEPTNARRSRCLTRFLNTARIQHVIIHRFHLSPSGTASSWPGCEPGVPAESGLAGLGIPLEV